MKLADSHIHLFRRGYRHDGQPSLFGAGEIETYAAIRQVHDVELVLVVGYEADNIDPGNNAYIRDLSARHPWIRTVAYIDPRSRPAVADIATLLDRGHCGLALYATAADRVQALLEWPRANWELLEARNAILSFNIRPDGIGQLRPLAAAARGALFLLSHLGLPGVLADDIGSVALDQRLAPLLSLADLPNVAVKISGLYATSDPPHAYPHRGAALAIQRILSAFGPTRCVWGSDFAPALEFVSYPQTIHWPGIDGLPDHTRDAIMRGNLVRLLR
jgi:predicted TIM-barrel fold metal-dependent hydrolase